MSRGSKMKHQSQKREPTTDVSWDYSRHADCQEECQVTAARGPVYGCFNRRCDMLVCEEIDAAKAIVPAQEEREALERDVDDEIGRK